MALFALQLQLIAYFFFTGKDFAHQRKLSFLQVLYLKILSTFPYLTPQLKIHKLAATSNKKDLLIRSRRLEIAI